METLREGLRELGLADARLALEEERAAELERKEDGGREPPVGEVVGRGEQRLCRLDTQVAPVTARCAITRTSSARYSALACRSDCISPAGTPAP